MLRDRARPWSLPLVLALCYERNDPSARSAHRALTAAQWADLLARRQAAERAVAAAAHAVAAAHARLRLLRRLVGLDERGGGGGRRSAAEKQQGGGDDDDDDDDDDDGRPAAAAAPAPPPTSSSPALPRRWLTAQEADKERTTLSEARKAADRALKALATAADAAEEAAGDADFAAHRAPRMAALARGLGAHGAWLQRRALRDVMAAGRRNEAGGAAAAAATGQSRRSEESDGESWEEDEDDNDGARHHSPARFPPLGGLVAAYRSVALDCFDCYSDPDLERRPPGPGLPASAGRRFARLVPRRALFPPSSSSSSDPSGGKAPSVPWTVDRRRLAGARRILAWVEAAADGEAGGSSRGHRQQHRHELAEVEEALAEGAFGVEPLPPLDVLLERAVALERRRARRGGGGARRAAGAAAPGGGALPLPPPAASPSADPARRGVTAGWRTDAWGNGGQQE